MLIKSVPRRAQKRHVCFGCGCDIEPDRVYSEASLLCGGKMSKYKMHIDCLAVFVEWAEQAEFLGAAMSRMPDPPVLFFFGTSGMDAKRGCYPHVICRMELTMNRTSCS